MIPIWVPIIVIGLAAILLIFFRFIFKDRGGYQIRHEPMIERWMRSHTAAIERQGYQNIFLGQHLFCPAFPGVGYNALSVLPFLLDPEIRWDGKMSVSAGDGSLLVLAQEIIQGKYRDGYHPEMKALGVQTHLYGPTPIAVTAGILPELHSHPYHSVAFLGNYGPEILTMATTARRLGGHVFVAAGSLISQATLFASVEDQLIGEEIFMLPDHLNPKGNSQAASLVEDILRLLLILALIVLAILKLVNIL